MERDTFCYCQWLKVPSILTLNISKERKSAYRQHAAKLLPASLRQCNFREAVIEVSQDAQCHWNALAYYWVYYLFLQSLILIFKS